MASSGANFDVSGDLELCEELGRGAYGQVYKARLRGGRCIAKRVPLGGMSEAERRDSRKEVDVLARLDHVNVVKCFGWSEDEDALYIAMEECRGGDLETWLNKRKGRLLPEREVMAIFVQVSLALHHVHRNRILHRDLKASNVFLSQNGTAKLGDFGISKVLTSELMHASTVIGTPYTLSPEVCQGKKYSDKADCWSLGCLLYELATLRRAFDGASLPALVMKILEGRYPAVSPSYSTALRGLISSLLQQAPESRPSTAEILGQPYVRSYIEAYAAHVSDMLGTRAVDVPEQVPRQPPGRPESNTMRFNRNGGSSGQGRRKAGARGGAKPNSQAFHQGETERLARHNKAVRRARPRIDRHELRRLKEKGGDSRRDVIIAPGPGGVHELPISNDTEAHEWHKLRPGKAEEAQPQGGKKNEEEADQNQLLQVAGQVRGILDDESPSTSKVQSESNEEEESAAAKAERFRAHLEEVLGQEALLRAYQEVREGLAREESLGSLHSLPDEQKGYAQQIASLILLEDSVFG